MKAEGDKSFYSFADFPIPSYWRAADGGKNGYNIISKNEKTEDVTGYRTSGDFIDTNLNKIDYYKIQYRYYEVEAPK